MASIIQLRRDTASNWTSANTVLAEGELGIETDTLKIKAGDGSTAWSSLSYLIDTGDYVTETGTQTLTNKTLTDPTITGTIVEDVYIITGTTPALDPANGSIQTWTLTGNSTPSESIAAGEAITLMVDDGASAYTIDWATSMSVTWVNNAGSAPTLATSGYTVIALWKVSTTLYGALVGDGT